MIKKFIKNVFLLSISINFGIVSVFRKPSGFFTFLLLVSRDYALANIFKAINFLITL